MEPPPKAPGGLARLGTHLDWYWTLSPPGRTAFWATFGGWALDAYNQMTVGFVLPAVTAVFASWRNGDAPRCESGARCRLNFHLASRSHPAPDVLI